MDCSRILMNHTCFLLIIGFVMLTRLDFAEALKQFAIVAVCSFVVLAVPFIMEKAYWLKRLRWIYGLIGLLLLAECFCHRYDKKWFHKLDLSGTGSRFSRQSL